MSRRFGIRMDGCGTALESLLKQHVATKPIGQTYNLVEIGSAGCVSLRAFSDILQESRPGDWRAIGFDLMPGKAWSLDMNEVNQSFAGLPNQIVYTASDMGFFAQQGMSLFLADDPRRLLGDCQYPLDFVFIDGSHGKSCALDFQAIESKVAPGGIVVFHDYGEAEQGTDWQQVDNEFINVRTYVHRLGLRQPTNRLRKGWKWVGEIPGSRVYGGDGNSAAVVQRTDEPLELDAPGLD